MDRKRLPVGSIVTVRKEEGLFMIIGYESEAENHDKYDYCLVEYPFGYKGNENILFLNKDYIKEVRFEGFKTKSFDNLNEFLNKN